MEESSSSEDEEYIADASDADNNDISNQDPEIFYPEILQDLAIDENDDGADDEIETSSNPQISTRRRCFNVHRIAALASWSRQPGCLTVPCYRREDGYIGCSNNDPTGISVTRKISPCEDGGAKVQPRQNIPDVFPLRSIYVLEIEGAS